MKICLAMIVRDEETVIERCLRSALPLIDTYCIVDTGSTDNTIEVVRQAVKDKKGKILNREWRGFADARTEMLRQAHKLGDYVLMLDADMTVDGYLAELTADAYFIRITGVSNMEWRLPLVTSTKIDWRYEGVCHSYLACDGDFHGENLDTLVVRHHGDARPRREKFAQDIVLLNGYLKEHPDDPRSVYYLAQSHKGIGDYRSAAELYRRRAHLPGWVEETFHARYREGQMRYRLGETERAVWCFLEAWAFRPTRAEPLRSLAAMYRERNVHVAARMFDEMADRIPMTDDRLFVEPGAYRGAATNLGSPIDWDAWRRAYDTSTFADQREFYKRVAQQHPVQHQWDAASVLRFLEEFRPKTIVEVGGWDGSMAAAVLAEFDWIDSWTNYEVAEVPQACSDVRYERVVLDDWPWERRVGGDALIASHVFEHMRMRQIEQLCQAWDVDYIFIDTPITRSAPNWNGYQGSHILEVGSTELLQRLRTRGFQTKYAEEGRRLVAYLEHAMARAPRAPVT